MPPPTKMIAGTAQRMMTGIAGFLLKFCPRSINGKNRQVFLGAAGTFNRFPRSYRAASSGEENADEEIAVGGSCRRAAVDGSDGSIDGDDHDRCRTFDRDDRAGGTHPDQDLCHREKATSRDYEGADRRGR